MLLSSDNPIMHIVGIEHLCWNGGTYQVEPREYSVLAFRIRGSATICSGGNKYHIHTNDILYLPQNMRYTADYTDTEIIAVHFVTKLDDPEIELYTFQNGEQIYKMFLRAHALWKKRQPGFSVYTMAQIYTILGMLLENETAVNMPECFLKAVAFINSNYTNNTINVNSICADACMSPSSFRQLFRKHYQKTPTQYITELRISHARNLISGGMTIESAAYESGFNDPKYFSRVVRNYFGCAPRDLKGYGK